MDSEKWRRKHSPGGPPMVSGALPHRRMVEEPTMTLTTVAESPERFKGNRLMRRCGLLLILVLTLSWFFPRAVAGLPRDVAQLIVSVAPDWNSSKGKLQLFERDGRGWRAVSPVIPALYGRAGLAWGRGVLGTNETGRKKIERDKRAPAGVFRIGMVYGYDAQLPPGSDYPYHQVSEADAWVDDPRLPYYNRHVRVDLNNPPAWFEKQKMRHGDFAYQWLVEIRHNADPPVPNAGSAIFFHIRRGVNRPTAGCTTIEKAKLESMIRWLRADENPHYALLPWSEYQQKWKAWGLPSPQVASSLVP